MSDRKLSSSLSNPLRYRAKNKKKEERDEAIFQEGPYDPVRGETAMWQAVLTQALMDAASGSAKPEAQQEKAEALRWLRGDSPDFITVCLNAGIEPAYARRMIRNALARNCRWRAEPVARPQETKTLARSLSPAVRRALMQAPAAMRELPRLAACWNQERLMSAPMEREPC